MSVREMLSRIDSRELSEWMAYSQIDPFGGVRSDIGAAMVASTIANVHATKGRTFRLSDFMPRFGDKPQQSQASMKAAFRAFSKACDHGNNRKT